MRFTGFSTLLILLLMASLAPSHADNTNPPDSHNFGTTSCRQQFSCANTTSAQITALAKTCASQGLGLSTVDGLFDQAYPDSNNCMTEDLPNTGSGRPAAAKCCVISNDDACSMYCEVIVY